MRGKEPNGVIDKNGKALIYYLCLIKGEDYDYYKYTSSKMC